MSDCVNKKWKCVLKGKKFINQTPFQFVLGHEYADFLNWFLLKINVWISFFFLKRSPKLRNKDQFWSSFCTVYGSHRHITVRDWFTFFFLGQNKNKKQKLKIKDRVNRFTVNHALSIITRPPWGKAHKRLAHVYYSTLYVYDFRQINEHHKEFYKRPC